MAKSSNGYSKLKEVIVGRELKLSKRISDLTFRQFYKESISQKVYERIIDNDDVYYVNQDLIDQRNRELDELSDQLRALGVVVYRPEEISSIKVFKTPTFTSECSSASNVRDLTLIYKDKIIETPTFVRNRYFENQSLYNIFAESTRDFGQWIKCPHTKMTEDRMDLNDWRSERDYDNFDRSKFDMAIDGAQFLRLGNDCIVGINSYNHYLGYLWVKRFFPEVDFHIIHVADNHIDGVIVALRDGYFLVDPKYKGIEDKLPEKFRSWKFLYPEDLTDDIDVSDYTDVEIRLASSRGMDINVLSIDENTVLVNVRATGVKTVLEDNGFKVIDVKLENGEIFAGGIHCSTLDILRDDED